jgi:hypothetical protein
VASLIHYNVWFSLKSDIDEKVGLAAVRAFLQTLKDNQQITSFQLLRNRAAGASTRLAPFHALITFANGDQFGLPFGAVAADGGPHAGAHGHMIEGVDVFIVEVFDEIEG